MRKQGFLQGAAILAVANILVKVIGMFFKIPLRRLIGAEGMGIYTAAYSLYNIMFVVATAGLPVAISKMVSESVAKNNWQETRKIYNIAKTVLFLIGLIGTAILFFGSNILAENLGIKSSATAIRALAPSLFFVSVLSVNRGMCQGLSNMVPTAISETIEASGKLFIGLLLAYILMPLSLEYGVAGAILGVTTGTFIAAAFMFINNRFVKKGIGEKIKLTGERKVASAKVILKKLIRLAVPITIGASVFTLASTIDLFMIMRQLESLGFDEVTRKAMYGYYSGDAVTMFNLPPSVITALSVSIVPAIASAFVKKDLPSTRNSTETAVRITLLFALPCAIGMSVLSEPILHLVMGDSGAKELLSILSYGIIFVCLVLVSNAILQAMGKVWTPVIHMAIGGAVKVIVNYILVGNMAINIKGAPVGTVLCYLVTASLNLISIHKYIRPSYGIGYIAKTVISTALMGVLSYYSYHYLNLLFPVDGTIGLALSLVISIGVGVVSYFGLLLVTKAIKRQDILAMPKSDKILKVLGRFL